MRRERREIEKRGKEKRSREQRAKEQNSQRTKKERNEGAKDAVLEGVEIELVELPNKVFSPPLASLDYEDLRSWPVTSERRPSFVPPPQPTTLTKTHRISHASARVSATYNSR